VCCAMASAIVAGQQPIFRGGSDTVRLFVTVTDKDGHLVTTLSKDDFELRDEGQPAPITLFDNTPVPIRLVVLLDVSASMRPNLSLLRDGTEQLLMRLRHDDMVEVGTFGGNDVRISEPFTNNVPALRGTLPKAINDEIGTPLWRAIDAAMKGFGAAQGDERRVVLVLTDGGNFDTTRSPVNESEIINKARHDGVMIYGIGFWGLSMSAMNGRGGAILEKPDGSLSALAAQTGGGYTELRSAQQVVDSLARVAEELHGQYLLGFSPSKHDGKTHSIDIRVATKGLKPRGRKNYQAPKE